APGPGGPGTRSSRPTPTTSASRSTAPASARTRRRRSAPPCARPAAPGWPACFRRSTSVERTAPMNRELTALAQAAAEGEVGEGDVIAREALLDWLEEHDDPRRDEVAALDAGWDQLASELAALAYSGLPGGLRRHQTREHLRGEIEFVLQGGRAEERITQAVYE